jgi:hypothetical protein
MRGVLAEWRRLPGRIEAAANLPEPELDRRAAPDAMTPRELVHHLAEAQVVAAAIVIAGLGSPGSLFDWSWMLPFGPWPERMQYATKPVGPPLRLIRALNDYVAAQIEPLPDGLERAVRLRDEPDGAPRATTVAGVLQQEIEHAEQHLAELRG